MFESDPSYQQFDSELPTLDALDIRSILLSSDLPDTVKTAPVAQTHERLMDSEEIDRLTNPHQPQTAHSDNSERLRIRREALIANKDSILVCILIRLPGVVYTIEINPEMDAIVHWEWQQV